MIKYRFLIVAAIAFCLLLAVYPNTQKAPLPPVAEQIKHTTEVHGVTLEDDYAWMRDVKWPGSVTDSKILGYLKSENNYANYFFSQHKPLKDKIFEELKGRIKLSDQSTYIKKDEYYYYSRIEENSDYPIYCRKRGSQEAKEEVILDVNELAKGKDFTSIDALSISPDHKLLAYSIDCVGDEKNRIRILDLSAHKYLPHEIENTGGNIVWHATKKGFFYIPLDDDLRHSKVMFHELGVKEDKLIIHEPNTLYQVGITRSSSLEYLIVYVGGYDSNECYVMDLNIDNPTLRLVKKRQDGIQYRLSHNNQFFYILTNDCGSNFCLKRTRIDALDFKNWEEYIAEDRYKYLQGFELTDNYLILNYKIGGLNNIIVRDISRNTTDRVGLTETRGALAANREHSISFPDAAFVAQGASTNFAEDDIRIQYSSLGRPSTTYSYDFKTDKLSIMKAEEIPSGFDPADYKTERIFADNDGVAIPISLLYKKALFKKDGSNPMYIYGYGAYGVSASPIFRSSILSLVDRGFVFALAHVRGGSDLGYDWYKSAKFLNKKRTFEDFISITKHLINEQYTKAGNIAIYGASAGGMLVGSVINSNPELYRAVVADMPFVDVLNTMLDTNLPLTYGEFKEWGDPRDPVYFNYIRSYSPYENVKAQSYPSLFVSGGISDSRVGYYEPAKWVARIRKESIGNNLILFRTDMDSGHSGDSGRFSGLKETADSYVFILNQFGIE